MRTRRQAAKMKGLHAVAEKLRAKGLRPAAEILTKVRAVPTRFAQFDHAVRVGGFPIERFSLVHGPSNQGKSLYALGLSGSFLARDHMVLYLDAERTTPMPWVRDLLGEAAANHPLFSAVRPDTYEGAIRLVRDFLNLAIELRKKGEIDEDTSALIVCDSLRKLVPKDLLKEVLTAEKSEKKERGKKEITTGRDRSAQLKAKMNAAWMDELIPHLEKAQAGFLAIAREMVDPNNTNKWDRIKGDNYVVGGGGAVFYDASLGMRIARAGWVDNGARDTKDRVVYGERHRITVRKTKVGGKDDKVAICHFHSSNGMLIPAGFDPARDLVELGRKFGIVKEAKAPWLLWEGSRWQGENAAVKALSGDAEKLARLDAQVRERFADNAPDSAAEES